MDNHLPLATSPLLPQEMGHTSASAASPLQGSAPVKAPSVRAQIAQGFVILTQLPKPTGAL